MAHPFRFGVQLSSLPGSSDHPGGWRGLVKTIERLGYSSVFCPDHFGDQWDPAALLTAAGVASEQLCVGTLVWDIDYRHPVVLAKTAATLQLLTEGRHEFGIGAGWMETDYVEAGMTYDSPGVRIDRLGEALQIIRSMWSEEKTSFEGKHFTIRDVAEAATGIRATDPPKILVGGGGKRLLRLAGRHADIVGINPKLEAGRVTAETPADSAPDRVRQKVQWVREGAEAAGRDADAIELNSLSFVVALTDDPKPIREMLSKGTGMTPEEVADCPLFLTGSAAELRERLLQRREETGISYVVIQGRNRENLEPFAEAIVEPLSGK